MAKKNMPPQEIIETFTKRRIIVNTLIYLSLFCFAFIFTSRFIKDVSLTGLGNPTEVGIAMGIITASLIGMVVYWRCPNCKKFLGIKIKPKECPFCKAKYTKG